MPHRRNPPPPSLPVANYDSAIARAVEWLGDRYLLARPMHDSWSRSTGVRSLLNGLSQPKSKSFPSAAS
jgi:hypothetical protein